MPTPSLIIPSAPVYDEGNLYGLNVYGTQFAPEAIPFTRATTATRTNSAGLIELVPYNLLVQSNTFNIGWAMFTGPAVTPNSTTSPDGLTNATTLNSSGGSNDFLYQSLSSLTIGATYSFSFYIKNLNSNDSAAWGTAQAGSIAYLNWSGSTLLSVSGSGNSFTSVGNGWYRVLLTGAAVTATANIRIYADINNTSKSVYIYGAQLVEGTAALPYLKTETRLNRPRVDFSLGGCPNLLLEPQRTNLLLNSVFSGSGSTPTSWIQAVGGGTSVLTTSTLGAGAQACSQSATLQRPFLYQDVTLLANTTYSYSIYIESVGGGLTNDQVLVVANPPSGTSFSYFLNGVSVSGSSFAVVGRLSVNIVVSSTGGSASFRCGIGCSSNSTGTLLFSRPQLEVGAYETSYIPTTTTSVTRNADSFADSNIFSRGMITAAGGTWFVELRNSRALTRDAFSQGIGVGNSATSGSVTNGFYLANAGGAQTQAFRKIISGTETSFSAIATGTVKLAVKWNGSTMDVFQNGVKIVNATAFAITNMEFLFGNGNDVPKYIQQMDLYPTPLSDTECINLTTL